MLAQWQDRSIRDLFTVMQHSFAQDQGGAVDARTPVQECQKWGKITSCYSVPRFGTRYARFSASGTPDNFSKGDFFSRPILLDGKSHELRVGRFTEGPKRGNYGVALATLSGQIVAQWVEGRGQNVGDPLILERALAEICQPQMKKMQWKQIPAFQPSTDGDLVQPLEAMVTGNKMVCKTQDAPAISSVHPESSWFGFSLFAKISSATSTYMK